MITSYGFSELLTYLAGQSSEFGSAIALGAGNDAVTYNDRKLSSEFVRQRVDLRSPDFVGGSVIFRATLGQEVSGKFYELALVNREEQQVRIVLSGAADEVWTNANLDDTNSRVGTSGVRIDAATSGNTTATIDVPFAIESNLVAINYFVGNNVSSAYVRLMSDGSNYYQYSLPTTAGYNSVEVPLSSFAVTGAPKKDEITSVLVYVASTAGGASQLHLDALMLVSPEREGDVLLRQVLAQPITKLVGTEMDIELPVNIDL